MANNTNGCANIEARIVEQWPDKITVVWCVEDVLAADDSLIDRQACLLLQRLDGGREALRGANLEVIEHTIDAMQCEGKL